MPVSDQEEIQRLIDYGKALEVAAPLICLLREKKKSLLDISNIGSLIVAYCYYSVLPGKEQEFLQVALDIIQQSPPAIREHVDMVNRMTDQALTSDQLLDQAFGPLGEGDA